MPARERRVVVFVHGWSVSDTRTYGGLPERLAAEAPGAGFDLTLREIYLGRYVSFRDEVRVEDLARAFEAAVQRELGELIARRGRFACITHSTGGPVIREWWRHYARARRRPCPMSHLVMLAPANFGSALASLGKGRINRLKSWFQGMEPGTGVLDWLDLGSPESWELNRDWIDNGAERLGPDGAFPFVLAGQTIDRSLYDPLVPLTAELGSDGVVRLASANLNAGYVRLEQQAPRPRTARGEYEAPRLALAGRRESPRVPFRIIAGASHSGPKRGIQRSVRPGRGDARGAATVRAVLDCLSVASLADYEALGVRFERESAEVERQERVESEDRILLPDTVFIHDRTAMVIVRVEDDRGHAVDDVDLLLTGGPEHDPNHLPQGFLRHVARCARRPGTVTYFFNHDVMVGTAAVNRGDRALRGALPGAGMLGLRVLPRPERGFVHYLPCDVAASPALLQTLLRPQRTTLVEIVLRRIVREGVFRLGRGTKRERFRREPPGPPIP